MRRVRRELFEEEASPQLAEVWCVTRLMKWRDSLRPMSDLPACCEKAQLPELFSSWRGADLFDLSH